MTTEKTDEKAEVTATHAEAIYDTLESLARDFDRHRDMLRRRAHGATKADSMDRREANTWALAASHMRAAVRDLREQVTVREWAPKDGETTQGRSGTERFRMPATLSLESRRWLNQAEAAHYLGVTDRTVRNYIARGLLPGHRVRGSRLVRIDRADLDALLRPIPAVGGGARAQVS